MNKKVSKNAPPRTMKSIVRRHDTIMAILLAVICLCGLLLNGLVTARYHSILESSQYIGQYKTSLEKAHSSLKRMVYQGHSDEAAGYEQNRLLLYQQGMSVQQNIVYTELWRDMTDLSCMTCTYLGESGRAYRLAVSGHNDAAIPIFEECAHLYELILQAINDCNEKIIDLNEQAQQTAQHFTHLAFAAEVLLSAGVMMICFLSILKLVGQTVNPLETFTKYVENVSVEEGELELLPADETGLVEVNQLQVAYNRFIKRINRQFGQVKKMMALERRLLEEEAKGLRVQNMLKISELKVLQSQINPHFLFNTLNMIASNAYLEGAEQTVGMIGLLGSYLRYNLDNANKTVSIQDEIENARDYLEIQKKRLGDRLDYHIQMDEQCAHAQLPCLILQPLVENSVSHGLRDRLEGGCIWVGALKNGARVQISVKDNGTGISPEELERLNHLQAESVWSVEERNRIGVHNVIARLQLLFDGDIRVQVSSVPNETTEFFLDVPMIVEEAEHDLYSIGGG